MSDAAISSILGGFIIFAFTFAGLMAPWRKILNLKNSSGYVPPADAERSSVRKRAFEAGDQPLESIFSFKGKLRRKAFLLTQLLNAVCMMIGFFVATGMRDPDDGGFSASGIYIVVAVLVIGLWISWAASTKRTRDTGINVWWVLALLVPPLNLAAMVFLLLVPTDEFKGRGL